MKKGTIYQEPFTSHLRITGLKKLLLIETKETQKELQDDISKRELFEQLDIERVSFEDKVRLENKFKMLLEYLNMK